MTDITLDAFDADLIAHDARRASRMTPEQYVPGSDPWENTEVANVSPF